MNLKRKTLSWPMLTALASALAMPCAALAQNGTQIETITYHDNTNLWKLGQVAQRTLGGKVVSSRTYHPTYALPLTFSSFGKLRQTVGYDLTSSVASGQRGTIATSTDGNGNTTVISQWMRGIPQLIGFADGTSQSAVVDLRGWLTSATDQNGFTTSYNYDAMGRIAAVTHPSGDTTAWNVTTQAFQQINAVEYGIPAGHWRQTVTTGNRSKVVYFDAMWRPLVTREQDNANPVGTARFQRFTYDYEGRVTFSSYPGASHALSTGQWTQYDALGRQVSVLQDSEHGQLTTLHQYLAGFQTRVIDPKGNQTTTSYLTYDQPTTDWPTWISHPEGAYTHIQRDVLGKPLQLRRSNSPSPTGGTLGVNRSYAYNDHEELCRVVEPETGATLMGYDAAGNLTWSAAGLPVGQNCEATGTTAAVLARRSTRQYDARNRLVTLGFPDNNGNQTWTYTPDGLPATITTLNDGGANSVVNTYTYNKRRMMTAETSGIAGWYTWGIGYGYNANGDLASQSYPTGLSVNYAPNALGQPTQAGSFATGVQYYPNGAIKQFTYGNGLVHTMVQNARQLPARSTDTGGALDHEYGYDQNGNVLATFDHNDSARSRWMAYDGLDRLTDAGSVVFGGDHWHRFTYDQLNNLKSWKLAGVKDFANYVYDGKNRLSAIQNTSGIQLHGMQYDVQGNRTAKDGYGSVFDFGNRLRAASGPGGWEYYRYDGHGRRVLAWTPAGSKLTMYSSSGQPLYQHSDPKAKTIENIYLGGSLVAARETPFGGSTIAKYQHTDALGSPVAVTDQAGTVIERIDYDPYGGLINGTVDGIGYTGHVMDPTTGLTYMQQRYYDPGIGVFLTVDSVAANGTTGTNFNRYWYANNNPYRYTDPDGRWAEDLILGIPSIILGAKSFSDNIRDGNYGSAVVDGLGIIADAAAIATPGVPGGAGLGIKAARGADEAIDAARGADSAVNGLKLNKQLASEQQLGEVMSGSGEVIAGGASRNELRDAPRLAETYGGEASDWTKVSSSSHTAPDGQQFSTHAYQNQSTGQVVEPKTKVVEENR